nr:OmpA family protein [Bacteroidales bacterium]
NFKLSQRRAFAAKRYLISKGVSHMQVIARGYGERYPLVDCKVCTEREHDINRRIEMEVINSKN